MGCGIKDLQALVILGIEIDDSPDDMVHAFLFIGTVGIRPMLHGGRLPLFRLFDASKLQSGQILQGFPLNVSSLVRTTNAVGLPFAGSIKRSTSEREITT